MASADRVESNLASRARSASEDCGVNPRSGAVWALAAVAKPRLKTPANKTRLNEPMDAFPLTELGANQSCAAKEVKGWMSANRQ